MLRRKIIILLAIALLCGVFAVPAWASGDSGVFNGPLEKFIDTDAFQIQDVLNLDGLPTDNAVSPVYVSPAKYSSGWLKYSDDGALMESAAGSWMKGKIVWKTDNGVDRYYFEVVYDGNSYELVKSDTMYEHEKTVVRN